MSIVAQCLITGRMCNREHEHAEWNQESSSPNDISEMPGIQETPDWGGEEQDEEGLCRADKVELKLVLIPKSVSNIVGSECPVRVH
jgi:hypothetical protein